MTIVLTIPDWPWYTWIGVYMLGIVAYVLGSATYGIAKGFIRAVIRIIDYKSNR